MVEMRTTRRAEAEQEKRFAIAEKYVEIFNKSFDELQKELLD